MSPSTTLVKRAVAILREKGLRQLFRRMRYFGKMRLLSILQRYDFTRDIYYSRFDSRTYWTQRYAAGRDSGPGSHDEYAAFKADFLNKFVADNNIETVLEFGCGDGRQVEPDEYPEYVGLEVSPAAVETCARRFTANDSKSFLLYDPLYFYNHGALEAELVISLEVLFHLIEDEIFEKTMQDIFSAATRYVIVFSSNHDDPTPELHIRHRKFTDYVAEEFPEFDLVERVENEYEERVSDFYIYEKTA